MNKPTKRVQSFKESGKRLKPLGKPPECFDKEQLSAWNMIVSNCHKGVLREADGIAVEQAARILTMFKRNQANKSYIKSLRSLFFSFGMTRKAVQATGI